ncbi:HVA22-like protein i [Psilocybe cubensis]|uniref:HVA22-like protein i n=2 Tax=Psilocybe cubensis TaxID=181762 RepID=A0ACB8GGC8_PSICU|nr:HVA22-like protein i [Psilocybe cubensis]KAH9474711.1 HVA22-like protein i [Psilocybe cubensis]
MLFSFTARIVSALAAFIYPGYASYKTLSQRPASEAELERWLMYWSVLGCIVGVEYIAEWLVSWIPFYTSLKALFLLYLALPQTQGSTYIYHTHLRPFLSTHERTIDSAIAEVRGRVYRFVQERAQALWAAVVASLAGGAAGAPGSDAGAGVTPPTQHGHGQQPAPAGPTQLLSSLWTSYGPGILAGGAALLRQTATATLPSSSSPASHTTSKPTTTAVATDPAERRRQLEAELAALSSLPAAPTERPSSFASSSSSASINSAHGAGRFEEIRGGEVEGYEVDDEDDDGEIRKAGGGWFSGWGAGTASGKGGYERVKSD